MREPGIDRQAFAGCGTCKRDAGDDYTIGCPECFDDEHKEEEED